MQIQSGVCVCVCVFLDTNIFWCCSSISRIWRMNVRKKHQMTEISKDPECQCHSTKSQTDAARHSLLDSPIRGARP